MIVIKREKNITFARLISYEFTMSNPNIESKFYLSRTNSYNLLTLAAFNNSKKPKELIGGINGNIIKNCFYMDEIWVKEDYRGMMIGKKMLKELLLEANKENLKCACYEHLFMFNNYFKSICFDENNNRKE